MSTSVGLVPANLIVKVAITAAFMLCAMLVNYFRVPLFFEIDFIFGSALALLALILLGRKEGVAVGIAAAAVTVVIWQHPYGLLIFSAEILWLSWRYKQGLTQNLVLLDLQFWLLALPAVVLCYMFLLDTPLQTAALIALKQLINGVFNTLLVSIFLAVLQLNTTLSQGWRLPKISLTQLVFINLMSLTLLAGSVPLLLDARQAKAEIEVGLADRLRELAFLMERSLIFYQVKATPPEQVKQRLVDFLPRDLNIALALSTTASPPLNLVGQTVSSISNQTESTHRGFALWQPDKGALPIKRWHQSVYRYHHPLPPETGYNLLILEQPAAPIITKLQQASAQQLLRLVLFFGISLSISMLLSKILTAPFKRLASASKQIQTDLASGQTTKMPQSNILEYASLADTLTVMSQALSAAFHRSLLNQQGLAQAVADRTHDLQQSHSQQAAILAAATDYSIIATDTRGIIRFFSRGAEMLLGYHANELVGKETPERFHLAEEVELRAAELTAQLSQDVTGFATFVVNAEREGSETREWTYLHKDGHAIPVSLTVTAITGMHGEVTGYLGIAKDISEQNRTEKLKNEFISTVSHELRTPLTSIYAALSLVNSGKLGPVSAKAEQLLTMAEKNSQRLTTLINDLLDIEKLIAGNFKLPLQLETVAPLIKQAVAGIASYAEHYNVSVVTDICQPTVQTTLNAARFNQVLTNLLSNAVKFSPPDAEVVVRLSTVDAAVKIEVIDQGQGVAEAFKPHIFDKFTQGEAANTRRQGGTGLGLAISKELTEKMGGQIGFESEQGRGSTFWLLFPMVSPTAEEADNPINNPY